MSLLEISGLTIRFGGHLAVTDVDLSVESGTVCGLIGPNGAGKTTTFNAISGVVAPSSGVVRFADQDVSRLGTHRRARLGIGRTFQRLEIFGSLTARENVLVGAEIRSQQAFGDGGDQLLAPGASLGLEAEVDLIVDRLGLGPFADVLAGRLPTGQARLVELGRALATRPRLLLLDEPASGLDERETEPFGDLLRELAAAGLAILLVEHDVDLVMATCSQISVLDFGQIIAAGTPAEIQRNSAVQHAYLGGDTSVASTSGRLLTPPPPAPPFGPVAASRPVRVPVAPKVAPPVRVDPAGEPLLELQGVRAAYGGIEVVHGIDLAVPAGTVVALLGPNGAGKSTTLSVACGLMTPSAGKVFVAGRDVTGLAAEHLARRGMVTIPEGKGIFPNLTVRENLLMVTYTGRRLSEVEEIAYARFPRLGERRKQLAGTMSGGEQQMLAMARGLASDPAVLLLDELSMGLAPLVVEELYGIVADIARTGTSILVVEQFARTVLGVADVAAIMVHGRIATVGAPGEIESQLSAAYLGS